MEGIPIQSLLVAVNAKYIHTNPAVRSIAAYADTHHGLSLPFAEFTINQRHSDVLRALYRAGADCYIFSCYIWNITFIQHLAADLRKLLPGCVIAFGGPEASWQAGALLERLPQLDIVLCGEGERSVPLLVQALQAGSDLSACPGISYRDGEQVFSTEPLPPIALAELPFAYADLAALSERIPYYESMRGCPFSCSYCLSSLDKGVRLRPLETVFRELQIFLDAGVRQVKLVDRTFNCDPARAMRIWRFLHAHDNGVTNFHFEMAGDLLRSEDIAFLNTVRPGLFQFEIGVQSTNPPTLNAIRRSCDFAALSGQVRALNGRRNIHLHLDLIAGLPHEDFSRFSQSFDAVYALAPQQLQLGFLKLLGGSRLRSEADLHGIVYQGAAPYEVLRTNWLTYDELCVLHGVDSMVDSFYNSGRFRYLLEHVVPLFSSSFAFYRALWEFYEECQQGAPLSKIGYYDLLGEFLRSQGIPLTERMQWLCRYDLLLHEKPRKLPEWVSVDLAPVNRSWLAPARREAGVQTHLEVFPFAPPSGPDGDCLLVFDYSRRDITGRAQVRITDVPSRKLVLPDDV